jgi:D-alanyl-D-alanine carboxypeptidase
MDKLHLSEKELLDITRAPGAQYILVNERETLLECYAGMADIISKAPVKAETTFNNFSVTKTATATAILLLVEQGKLRLEDQVNDMFDEYHFTYPFTLQQLLAHQAGFADPVPISWIHLPEEENTYDENQFIRQILAKHSKQKFIPGSKFSYSSVGYLLLSKIIEKFSGESYSDFVSKNILAKLPPQGSLGFTIPDERLHATGYHPRFSFTNLLLSLFLDRKKIISYNHGRWTAFKHFYVNGKAYGGFIGNVRGLSSYLQSFLSNKIFQSPDSQRFMWTEQKGGMALGWFTGQLNGQRYVCHAGGGGGYYCEIRIYPDLKIASALLRNKSSFSDQRLLDKIDGRFIQSNI